jgi:assimilatory nitrate reductase catalytic subunit
MATNPAMSLPRAGAMRDALGKLELFVVSENVISNDTVNAGAHILLPAAAWGEKDGTVTNSERRISRQRKFLALPGEAKPDWLIVTEVARRMGFAQAFPYRSAADVFREHAALSASENGGTRDFDLEGLSTISDAAFDALSPVQWPLRAGKHVGERRIFADGQFFTPDRKARFVAPEPPMLRDATSAEFPFRLNTGRIRDQWHSMTRTGKSARLAAHMAEPFVEVHPEDARAHDLVEGGFARVTTAHGSCVLKVNLSEGQRKGSLFVPIHWSGENSASARVGDLVAPHTDPYSGQPEAKATPATLMPVALPLRGFLQSRRPLALPQGTCWALVATAHGAELRFATERGVMFWHDFAHRTLGLDAQLIEQLDAPGGIYRAVAFVDGEFDSCLSVGPGQSALRWDNLAAVIAAGPPRDATQATMSACGDTALAADISPTICACFSVGREAIEQAVRSGAAKSITDITRMLQAGNNCGSCLPELKRIIARERAAAVA